MSQETHVTSSGTQQTTHGREAPHHPTPATYFKVAMTLTVITAVEVAVLFFEWLGHAIIPILILLSAAKFLLVAMYYMHLKFESPIFSGMFVTGLIVAAGVIIALMGLFRFFTG